MKSLKQLIRNYMYRITIILVSVILICVLYIQLHIEQGNAIDSSKKVFLQMEQLLKDNQAEIEEIQEEYKQTCLYNVEVVARIIESNPDVLNSIDELKAIAKSMEVDEIHVFDSTGRIFTGTHPEYYDLTFDSGEQIKFFKPLLNDKTLKLVQDITPNTAEQKLMQYSALWSENGKYIVQIGMEPNKVMKVTEKNELSHIFSQFRVNTEVYYFAINVSNGIIVGSNNVNYVNLHANEIGLDFDKVSNDNNGFHCEIDGINCFCVFQQIGTTYIGRCISSRDLYQRIPATMILVFICLVVVAFILVNAVTRHMNQHVVNKIREVNTKLESIANGNLSETINIKSSIEFHELSSYINSMVKSILENNKKMSYVLSKTDLYIGIYEYNTRLDNVQYSEYVSRILNLEKDKINELASNKEQFKAYINNIINTSSTNEDGIYKISNEPERYIKLEEINNDGEIFGVVIDITAEVLKRKKLEVERDIDTLTNLYNRRGFDIKLNELADKPKCFLHSAIVMIDADDLKSINDTYGHEKGDIYIKELANLFNKFDDHNTIKARLGGDEFILLFYNFDDQSDLINQLVLLKDIQDTYTAQLTSEISIPIKFSYGYSFITEITDFNTHLRDADRKMYLNKLDRKK